MIRHGLAARPDVGAIISPLTLTDPRKGRISDRDRDGHHAHRTDGDMRRSRR